MYFRPSPFTRSSIESPVLKPKGFTSDRTEAKPPLFFNERLTGTNAEIKYNFEDMNIQVPSGTGADAEHAKWVLNGAIKISTNEKVDSPKS